MCEWFRTEACFTYTQQKNGGFKEAVEGVIFAIETLIRLGRKAVLSPAMLVSS
jgi:hypothetical protein